MHNKTAFIVGILGQDGYYLRNILLKKGYDVIGFDRRITSKYNPDDGVSVFEIDLTDYNEVLEVFKKYNPTHVFNLAGVTNVIDPWKNVDELMKSTVNIPHNLMRSIINRSPQTVFCQASSCLVYGKTKTTIQNESTPRSPIYPYGFCKNFIDELIKGYRETQNLNFYSAIFYNHDSPFRANHFFIKKLINFAKSLKTDPSLKITFNNLNVNKDLGYAKDYMEAFALIGEINTKNDYIISSGKLTNLKDVVSLVSNLANIDLFNHITVSSNHTAHDSSLLFGDHSNITKDLGWKPSTPYEEVVKIIWENN